MAVMDLPLITRENPSHGTKKNPFGFIDCTEKACPSMLIRSILAYPIFSQVTGSLCLSEQKYI